jgi:hypothetical protein
MEVLRQDAMDLQLVINEVPLRLAQALPTRQLARAGFRKRNLLLKLLGRRPHGVPVEARRPLGRSIYDAENCSLFCFGDRFHLYACTDSYLDPDRQWQTAASLGYDGGRLAEVQFAVIDGRTAAATFLERFVAACERRFGPAADDGGHRFSWDGHHSRVVCELADDLENASFAWIRRNDPPASGAAGR